MHKFGLSYQGVRCYGARYWGARPAKPDFVNNLIVAKVTRRDKAKMRAAAKNGEKND